jgi:hypothetical protein
LHVIEVVIRGQTIQDLRAALTKHPIRGAPRQPTRDGREEDFRHQCTTPEPTRAVVTWPALPLVPTPRMTCGSPTTYSGPDRDLRLLP